MLCEKCKKNEATVFYEENINGKTRSYSLCADCAGKMEETGEISFHHNFGEDFFSLPSFGPFANDLFGGLFGLPESTRTGEKVCPICHSTLEDFRRKGKTGCPECYKTFADELDGTIRSIHGNVKHIGRAPSRFKKRHEAETRLADLKNQLKSAVSDENFELAAKLRDEIRSIESGN